MANNKELKKDIRLQNLRSALLNWYPFSGGSRALLLGENTAPVMPLLQKHYCRVDVSPESGAVYGCIAAMDLIETSEDVPALLDTLNRSLDDEGVLLLAFRNRFGLKYLCGGVDEYAKVPFSALQPADGGRRLYARNEMKGLLMKAGFAEPRFYYLMPDMDFVQAVYTDEHLPDESIRDRVFSFDLHDSPLIAWEGDLYDDMVREGTLPYAANVYLAECRKPAAAAPRRNVIYAALSTDRERACSYATVLYSDGTAAKKPLFPEGLESLKTLCANMAALEDKGILTVPHTFTASGIEMPLIREEGLLHYLRRQLPEHIDAFVKVFDRIRQDVLQSSEPAEEVPEDLEAVWGAERKELGPILKSALIDMIPYNAFWAGGRIRYYDQEFRVENCPAKYVLFRALRYTWLHIPEAEKYLPLEEMKKRYGLSACWDGLWKRECRFVSGSRNYKALKDIYDHAFPDRDAVCRRCNAIKSV